MPESALSRLQILPTVTTHSRNSSENLINGDTLCLKPEVAEWSAWSWEWAEIV